MLPAVTRMGAILSQLLLPCLAHGWGLRAGLIRWAHARTAASTANVAAVLTSTPLGLGPAGALVATESPHRSQRGPALRRVIATSYEASASPSKAISKKLACLPNPVHGTIASPSNGTARNTSDDQIPLGPPLLVGQVSPTSSPP